MLRRIGLVPLAGIVGVCVGAARIDVVGFVSQALPLLDFVSSVIVVWLKSATSRKVFLGRGCVMLY